MDEYLEKLKLFYETYDMEIVAASVLASTVMATVILNGIVTRRIINGTRIQIDWKLS
jgi:hypothetical protein